MADLTNTTTQAVTDAELDAIILAVRHDGRSSDELSYVRDVCRAVIATRAPAVAVVAEPVPVFDDWPEFNNQAMGCGLEDRNITDRYEAMRYGWDEAIEHTNERYKSFVANTAPPSTTPSDQLMDITDMLELESLTPVEGFDEIYKHYETTFSRTPDAFMGGVVAETEQRLMMWWGAHRDAIRAALVAHEAAPPGEGALQVEPHLFEFWWAEYMPTATQARAWGAWQAAPEARNVSVAVRSGSGASGSVPAPQELDLVDKRWRYFIEKQPVPVLYSDVVNGEMVRRDDLWLVTTGQLKTAHS